MNKDIIAVTTLNTGEVSEAKVQLSRKHSKYPIQGHKMYTKGILELIDVVSKVELKRIIEWHANSNIIGKHNILLVKFKDLTKDMTTVARSKFKRKLLDNEIIVEYGSHKRLMLNPYAFLPRNDKNVDDSQHMDQLVWKYLVLDKDTYDPNLSSHIKTIFEDD